MSYPCNAIRNMTRINHFHSLQLLGESSETFVPGMKKYLHFSCPLLRVLIAKQVCLVEWFIGMT